MSVTREDLLDLLEETYSDRHPNFDAIREQYTRIIEKCHDESIESDIRLLLAGLGATENTYDDWEHLSEHERAQSIEALEQVKDLTEQTLQKYGVSVD